LDVKLIPTSTIREIREEILFDLRKEQTLVLRGKRGGGGKAALVPSVAR